MEFQAPELHCSLTMEQMSSKGNTPKRVVHRCAVLSLGRNEFRDIIMKVDVAKKSSKYPIDDISIHKTFVKDGKATIKLIDQNIQFMLANCPPDQLVIFLKIINTKLACLKQKPAMSGRQKLLSTLPKSYEDISPLTVKELKSAHTARQQEVNKTEEMFTPKSKRKRVNNENPQPSKFARLASNKNSKNSSLMKQVLNPVVLTSEQNHVLRTVKDGKSIFFTGSAGTGKSFLLKRIIASLAPHATFPTASTGVAACHINGTTLHAFAGIGSGSGTLEHCVQQASRPMIAQQWKKCKHLIIDEVSMVDGAFFTKLETVARVIRKNDAPFGGIQLIVCGDFLQLPPVTGRGETRKFAFQCSAWKRCIEVNFELTEVKRQNDRHFIDILQNIRLGRCTPDLERSLVATGKNVIEKDGILATRLCTHKEDVNEINNLKLNQLEGDVQNFQASDSDPGLVRTINGLSPVLHNIELKVGAQVMLTKNLDVQRGLVNGARGVVESFQKSTEGYPVIKFICGQTIAIRPERWSFKVSGGVVLTRRQLPIKLAWAISIHKSQGMSLDCVEISLERVFECGQAYVALSRARSMEGLRVLFFNAQCAKADKQVLTYYKQLQVQRGLKPRDLNLMSNH